MFEKILQELKTKYKHLGLSETILKAKAKQLAKAVEKEEEIENAVAGVEDDLAIFQSFADQNRTLAKKLEELEKAKGAEPKTEPNDFKPADTKPMGETDNAVLEMLKSLKEEIVTLKAEKVAQTNAEKLQAKLTELKVSKSYLDLLPSVNREFASDEEIEAYANDLKAKSDVFEQSISESKLASAPKPLFGETAKEGEVSPDVQAYIDSKKAN